MLVDWRIAEYLRKPDLAELKDGSFICRMLASSGRPILKLPDRAKHPMVPRGPTNVIINGEGHVANFVKLFVNVVHRHESNQNVLTEILRGWFGPRAGLPGTKQEVVFDQTGDGWTMRPVTVPHTDHNEEASAERATRAVRLKSLEPDWRDENLHAFAIELNCIGHRLNPAVECFRQTSFAVELVERHAKVLVQMTPSASAVDPLLYDVCLWCVSKKLGQPGIENLDLALTLPPIKTTINKAVLKVFSELSHDCILRPRNIV